ncbi:hypothetical protein KI427_27320 (plasmid) [Rhodococcus ruber]|jgi:hypothetical protein|uniref:Uncharacterized protein n=2 Tax=Rhodococcus TaxID=1827 RepID=A0AAW4XNW4_RHORH|nr:MULTISPECIES: hypothetical protein [Rhodococcus]NLE80616.1 hypothetical protein [Rhodococcus sp. (in: high G+C Gram-positive bacteria)]ABI79375.1 hypothetical protein PNSL1.047 [Rhodococcus sp. NS1]MCD2114360.1 hypothetical protein [Rhodococcus rhodochrous]MCD5422522.1 hypothetical protein [Rhodococcus pyridinivorans]MDV6296743.1 hypothetical protein [Rhodococcus aetherivorans]
MNSKLTDEQLDDIREYLAQGMSPDDIANYIGRVADLDLIEIEYVRTAANELEHENQQHGEKP